MGGGAPVKFAFIVTTPPWLEKNVGTTSYPNMSKIRGRVKFVKNMGSGSKCRVRIENIINKGTKHVFHFINIIPELHHHQPIKRIEDNATYIIVIHIY